MAKLQLGEAAPSFQAPTLSNPRYEFHTVAGRPIFLVFLGSPGPAGAILRQEVSSQRAAFNDRDLAMFYVVNHPSDIGRLGIAEDLPGIRCFLDYDHSIAERFGFTTNRNRTADFPAESRAQAGVVLLDRTLRALQTVVVTDDDKGPVLAPLLETLHRLSVWQSTAPNINHAPVLVVERVFELSFCRTLIAYYMAQGGIESGFMREKNGLTVKQLDPRVKRRTDCLITDEKLRKAATARVSVRLRPLIRLAFQFDPTRLERHIVSRYDATSGGFFAPHRDNTTKGTAHRRFAVTINLNADEYEGGDLRLPEFGQQAYRAPTGGALVFSCSLLHEALPVTKGTRYAYLPFLYGEEDAALRELNLPYVADDAP
jgi:hypothetical protein